MNVIECAELLRSNGFQVYTWRPKEGTVEPDLVAKRDGQLYNVYLSWDKRIKRRAENFALAHKAQVMFIA